MVPFLLFTVLPSHSTSSRKDGEAVPELTEQQIIRLAMSPLYAIYAVASAHFPPDQITRRQIVRAIEYGLSCEQPLGMGIFELLKMHLHEFFANFPREFTGNFDETCFQELLSVDRILRKAGLPPEGAADLRKSLRRLAMHVGEGAVFGSEVPLPAMTARAASIEALFDE